MYTNPGLSRGQLASIDVPKVIYVDDNDIQLIKKVHADSLEDPFSLLHRPSETVVEKALKMLRQIYIFRHCLKAELPVQFLDQMNKEKEENNFFLTC